MKRTWQSASDTHVLTHMIMITSCHVRSFWPWNWRSRSAQWNA